MLPAAAHGAAGAAAQAGAAPLVPQLAIVLACVVWSLGTIYMRNHALSIDLFALMGLQMLLGGVWMVLCGVLRGEPALWQWSRPGLLALAYLVVFSACLAYLAYAWLARHATPAQTGTYSYVNPALATFVGLRRSGRTHDRDAGVGRRRDPGRRADDQLADDFAAAIRSRCSTRTLSRPSARSAAVRTFR